MRKSLIRATIRLWLQRPSLPGVREQTKMRNSGFFKLTGLVVAAALLLAVLGQTVFGQDADSGTGGASSDPQPANVLLEVTASAIDQLDLVDKGSATPDFAALAADAAGEDGMPETPTASGTGSLIPAMARRTHRYSGTSTTPTLTPTTA